MTKEFFVQVLELDKKINAKLEQLDMLNNAVERITSNLNGMPSAGTEERGAVENYCIRIADLSSSIYQDNCRLNIMRGEILDYLFAEIDNASMRKVLTLYFVEGQSYDEIGNSLHYTTGWVRKRIKEFLNSLPK